MVKHQRIKLSELDKNIFRPNETLVLDPDNSIDPVVTVYTIKGKEDEIDSDGLPVLKDTLYERPNGEQYIVAAETFDDAYAKKTFNGKRPRYYVKMNQRGDLYSPFGMYEEWNNKKKKDSGEPTWQFREVNQRVFDFYTSFLKTKNKAYLQNADRAHK